MESIGTISAFFGSCFIPEEYRAAAEKPTTFSATCTFDD